jgi:hypothetical protein
MDYQIKQIDISKNENCRKITVLINEVFNLNLADNKITLNTLTRNNKTLYLGAFYGDELAAVNVFIAHELIYNNNITYAYQSCWSATAIKHRKKGLFSLLINKAKVLLKEAKGAFIFGYPNKNSHPIFIRKLGFYQLSMSKLIIPTKLFPKLFLKYYLKNINEKFVLSTHNHFIPIEAEVYEWKKKEYKEKIKFYANYNNFIWGKKTVKKLKFLKLKVFIIGGIQINKPHLLYLAFRDLIKNEKVDLIQFASVEGNSILDLFNRIKPATKTEPLIVYDLNINTRKSKFNFITGIKDVF